MGSIPKFTNLTYNSNLGGTTGTKLYRNSSNNKWVVKQAITGGGYDQVVIESIANSIYRVCGIPAPNFYLDVESKALVLQYIDGKTLYNECIDSTDIEYQRHLKTELTKGFIVDALIANWDVIGLNYDNIIVPSDKSPPVRIDNGGSFYFRAQGNKKKFPSNVVNELDTLRDKTFNSKTASMFAVLTDGDINTQIKEIIVPNYDKILECIPIQELKDTVKGRMDFLIENTVWTNATAFKNTVVETSVPEYIEPVQKALEKLFIDGYNSIPTTNNTMFLPELIDYLDMGLFKYKAIISGGFILKAIGAFVDDTSVDIDIYVPSKHIIAFKEFITPLFNSNNIIKEINSDTTPYLKKNGIITVTKYAKHAPSYAEMDIIEVNPNLTPKNVVQNFDLTFCENWYDGDVYLTYPDHVKEKHGFLENHYLNLYHSGNRILKGRMNKYINRGFKISINNPVTKTPENITNIIKEEFKNTNNRGKPIKVKKPVRISKLILDSIKTKIDDIPEGEIKYNTTTYDYQSADNIPPLIYRGDESPLTPIETKCVTYYLGNGYGFINKYLYSNYMEINREPYAHLKEIFEYINTEHRNTPLTNIETYECALYYAFINLYNAIQKGPKLGGSNPIMVFRNTTIQYLSKDSTQFYYMNSFVSTSRVRLPGFGRIHLTFLVHPMCKYANLNTGEKEVLLTPYHRCIFLKEIDNVQTYLIVPTNLKIPDTFQEFNKFKNNVRAMTSPFSGGGESLMINTLPYNNKRLNNRMTLKTRNSKKLNNTLKNNKSMSRNMNTVTPLSPSLNDVPDRFSAPIPTFPANKPTEEEWKIINQYKALLESSDFMKKTRNSKR
jgi:hypothetical protein